MFLIESVSFGNDSNEANITYSRASGHEEVTIALIIRSGGDSTQTTQDPILGKGRHTCLQLAKAKFIHCVPFHLNVNTKNTGHTKNAKSITYCIANEANRWILFIIYSIPILVTSLLICYNFYKYRQYRHPFIQAMLAFHNAGPFPPALPKVPGRTAHSPSWPSKGSGWVL